MPPAVTLEGCRVRLEPLSLSHVAALVRAATQARDTFAFTMVPADHAAMTRYVQAALADQSTGWALPFAIYDLRSQAVVGSTRFLDLDYWSWPPAWPPGRTTPRPDAIPTVAEIGSTWLAPAVQRTGCNPESKLLMLGHAFDVLGCRRVEFKTDSNNEPSRTALLGIGATFEGIFRNHMVMPGGRMRHSAYYSVIDEEWPSVKAGLERSIRR